MDNINGLGRIPCYGLGKDVRRSETKEEMCSALFALKACLTQKEGFLANKGLLTGRDAKPERLQRIQERSAKVAEQIAKWNCK